MLLLPHSHISPQSQSQSTNYSNNMYVPQTSVLEVGRTTFLWPPEHTRPISAVLSVPAFVLIVSSGQSLEAGIVCISTVAEQAGGLQLKIAPPNMALEMVLPHKPLRTADVALRGYKECVIVMVT